MLIAVTEWITSKTIFTETHWRVTNRFTLSIDTTCVYAGIFAFLIDTGLVRRTFTVARTFRSAIWWWTKVVWHTSTRGWSRDLFTDRIRSTRRWSTWSYICYWSSCNKIIILKYWNTDNNIQYTKSDKQSTPCYYLKLKYLLNGTHLINGSPVYLGGQMQIGLCLTTLHFASTPHDPTQGSIHFWLLHALLSGQSELTTHSGLHRGGLPRYPATHEHTACPFISLHWLLGPHGDGIHGFVTMGTAKKIWLFYNDQV